MPRRLVFLSVLAALLGAGVALADVPRIAFEIATGSTTGTFFPVGEAIAGLISHPPGVARCDTPDVCGPAGLIVSARTSQGTLDNVLSVNDGDVDSGLAQSDVVAAAVAGRGPFRRKGKQSHVRMIAALFSEDVQLVVAQDSRIQSVSDLRGKRVSFGLPGAGVGFTAEEILKAYRVPSTRMRRFTLDTPAAIDALKQGRIDAFFAVGAVPLGGVGDLIASHAARLVPIAGPSRERLTKEEPALAPAVLAYHGQAQVGTVAARAVWIVRDSVPDNLVYAITRALFNPANRAALAASHPSARELGLTAAAMMAPAPLHPGAARFYEEAGARAQR
ncbi:MAG: TAXI family TRAP transporter solute-binding subunit [Rhizomicrobium sp.]